MIGVREGKSTAVTVLDTVADIDPRGLLTLETGDIGSAHVSSPRKMQPSSVMGSQSRTSSVDSKNCPSKLPVPPGTTMPGSFGRISAPLRL